MSVSEHEILMRTLINPQPDNPLSQQQGPRKNYKKQIIKLIDFA